MRKQMSVPTVTPELRSTGQPIRKRGRWTYVSHQWNGPVWRLDGTTLDLEHDTDNHSVCIGSRRCNGAWVLDEHGRHIEPVDEYLTGAMYWVEKEWDRRILTVVTMLAISRLLGRRFGTNV